jgi:hypothetical protein
VTAEVRGDQLAGQILTADGALPVRGTRGRKWGAPVRLLAEKGLEGWRPRDRSRPFRWTCEGGMLRNGEHDVDIVSLPEFDDFTLSLQYRIAPGGNSGIYLRGRYEVQIIGSDRIDKHGNCAVYSRLEPKSNPFRTQQDGEDQWQTLEATLIDRYLTLKLNGQPIFENVRLEGITGGALNPFEHTPGPIMLQGDHGQVAFRNIVVYPAK